MIKIIKNSVDIYRICDNSKIYLIEDKNLAKTLKKPKNYVNNREFFEAIVAYREKIVQAEVDGKQKPVMPKYIGECIQQIATRLATKPNFAMYPFVEDMIYDGIENCITYFHDFDVEKGQNPFAYFTQIIYYAFLRRIEKEKKQLVIKHKMLHSMSLDGLLSNYQDGEGDVNEGNNSNLDNDYMSKLTQDYEKKIEEKRKTKKVKPAKGLENFYEEISE